jgi:predicted TIM-barrel fold metal-dependent hydrolase
MKIMAKDKLKVIDAHFHVWDLSKQSLPWLDTTDGSITHTYTINDYLGQYAALNDAEFVGGVYVEVDEADPIQEDELSYGFGSDKVLARMLRAHLSPYMRVPVHATGIREPLHIPSQPKGRCLEQSFVGGLKALAQHGMPFDSCNLVGELGDLYEALKQVPEETVILNHLGNVEKLDDAYKSSMKKLATLPNLYVKVSGFPTKDPAFVHELLSFIRDTFPPYKLMYASNWPVVEMYSTFAENFKVLHEAFGDDEDFFMNNAARAYGIKL